MSASRFVVLHGHFYQPPRENPWLDRLEVQDSAAPYHDWNARVTAECYAPNAAARRVDAQNRILDIVNNFAHISFNVGPTLFAWLERERPDVCRAILDADRASRAARGHGNAIAQAYGHAILPLCSRRDKVTHVRWGLAEFRHRFGRDAEGLWLPETAVDRETLEVLAEEGVGFTILAPGQAEAVREPGRDWAPVGAGVDPRRAYRCELGGSRGLALFFYDGPISHAIAFGGLLGSGEALAARLLGGLDGRPEAQLAHVATDGESYGHHHRFGEMALAAACASITAAGAATLTNYAAFLAAHPPAAAARVVERSSWSCAHGVERWRADCGCRADRHPGWHQRWRGPLREALDWLRDTLDPLFEACAGGWLKDPWAARDEYVRVILDRSPASVGAFLDRHQRRPLTLAERVQVFRSLELQRQRLLMYTSCGWFFDEISGIETVQVLRYAARAVQLAGTLSADAGLEAELVRRLAAAPSNLTEVADGAGVWRRDVAPQVADLRRVAAHYAIAAPSQGYGDVADVYAYRVERLGWAREAYGEASLTLGRVRVTSQVTTETEETEVGVLHFGGHDVHTALRPAAPEPDGGAAHAALFATFGGGGLAEVVRALDRHFGGRSYSVADVFLEERRHLLALLAERSLDRLDEAYRRAYEEGRRLLQHLRGLGEPPPPALALAAHHVLDRALRRELAALAEGGPVAPRTERVRELLAEAASLGLGLQLPAETLARPLEVALARAIETLRPGPTYTRVAEALGVLALGPELGVRPDLWAAQNEALRMWRTAAPSERDALAPLLEALGFGAAS